MFLSKLEKSIEHMKGRLAGEQNPAVKAIIRRNLDITKQKAKNIKRKNHANEKLCGKG